jgi:hypothetical protein
MDDERLKNTPGKGQTDYFDELSSTASVYQSPRTSEQVASSRISVLRES